MVSFGRASTADFGCLAKAAGWSLPEKKVTSTSFFVALPRRLLSGKSLPKKSFLGKSRNFKSFRNNNKRECAYTDALILSILCNRFELKDMKGSPKMNVVSLALSRDSTLLMRRDSPKVILLKPVQ